MASSTDASLIDEMEDRTGLDRGQCVALVAALTREYALIQGPPGTGKSYLGVKLIQVLLASKEAASLGPIVIICYTNHALDQFLTHLKEVGITRIIRIGGQSRSPELQGHNLKVVSASYPKTKHEGYILGTTYTALEDKMKALGKRLGALHKFRKGSLWEVLDRFLQRRHPEIHHQLLGYDAEGFTTVGQDLFTAWMGRQKDPTPDVPAGISPEEYLDSLLMKAEADIYSLGPPERWMVADHWLQQAQAEHTERLLQDITDVEEIRDKLNTVHNEVNRRALLTTDIIGITTTGLARDVSTLRRLRAKVVVCEEAAEVLEAHTISALMPGVEHFIQIGDHQQLRPQINNYSLSLETPRGLPYQLDRSQFERLALGQPGLPPIPIAQLNVQRRMRPEISRLIRNTMYPNLEDYKSVRDLPNVVGIRENVFWLNHENMEDTTSDDGRLRSHSNAWEVSMTKALVRHFIRQGEYKSTDIAILTPYTGQLQKLRVALSQDFEIVMSERDEETLARDGFAEEVAEEREEPKQRPLQRKQLIESLRLATVDNFQGEEAKVIIVSLVRSNEQKRAGFLRTKNRINVLLSRAQYGMYLIGNVTTYANIPMWVDVYRQLEEAGAVGRAFNLVAMPENRVGHVRSSARCAVPIRVAPCSAAMRARRA
ncbi:putative nfx1-type zinc finger-containing protein 1 protein [Phaeoacremonium minimum UCRPA7]|uniref:Putative nfx1-type zinc finger-containing protein 1 protein n=1 Tax=Phaeoacremonium minimum (strain UCR-PA7) TaxID=1286976 RepID=R8BCX9_PHAM7|nr:putative nfx1-type zinc finger-containing protein 1 protein [Phaeoacremonium minimum UCRPA7]EON97158.1 putative nfx1-type zinc finger-containing protein 1 protein [Phaeoacremonium minimum UCRPA7]